MSLKRATGSVKLGQVWLLCPAMNGRAVAMSSVCTVYRERLFEPLELELNFALLAPVVGPPQLGASGDQNLIRLVAKAHHWFEEFKTGRATNITEIADREDMDFSDVTRTMRLAFLASDIIGSILEGYQPSDLTAFHLKRISNLPLSWDEQRKMLGFPISTRS